MKIFPRAARPLGEVIPEIEQRLLSKTPPAIRRAAAREESPLWCCALVFDSSLPQCFPELAISTVAEREKTLRAQGRSGRAHIWWGTSLDGYGAAYYEDAKLTKMCDEANETMRQRGTALPAKKLLVRVARALNAVPRGRFGKVAEEFVVYVFDRNDKPQALLPKCLTADRRAILKRLHLL